jgi:hypothetical protein
MVQLDLRVIENLKYHEETRSAPRMVTEMTSVETATHIVDDDE